MALAYTAPTWTDGSGQGISAAQLQALCNCVEGLVQGSDKAVHGISMTGSVITLTFADGSVETVLTSDMKGITRIDKTSTVGLVDTYTITYTDGTTSTFTVTNGEQGEQGEQGPQGETGEQGPAGNDGVSVTGVELLSTSGKIKTYRMTFSDGNHFDYQVKDGNDGSGDGDMKSEDYDAGGHVFDAGGIAEYVSDAIEDKADKTQLDSWTPSQTINVTGDSTVSFTVDTTGKYEPWFESADGSQIALKSSSLIGTTYSMTVNVPNVSALPVSIMLLKKGI